VFEAKCEPHTADGAASYRQVTGCNSLPGSATIAHTSLRRPFVGHLTIPSTRGLIIDTGT
jgi:hypothetical protein